jgi:BirA family transcriptional regulator, biotin operon repressor / biotin---[acetyl-CoA-carboxylase] ligase
MQTRLIMHQEAESTQDLAKAMALGGAPEGAAVMTLKQTSGRGRSGHTWISPAGKNLALSLLLRPRIPPDEIPLLGLMAAVAVAETVEAQGILGAELKWPNDVLVSGKKLAGILPEAGMIGNSVSYVIMGVGLNVNSEISDFPPELQDSVTSLFICASRRWDLVDTARELLKRMERLYNRVDGEGPGFIPDLWSKRWAHLGRTFAYNGVTGVGRGINPDGSLILKTDAGQLLRVTSGIMDPI